MRRSPDSPLTSSTAQSADPAAGEPGLPACVVSLGFRIMTGMSLSKVIRNGWVQASLIVFVAVLLFANLERVLDVLLAIPLRAAEFAEEEDLGSRLAEYVFELTRS